jgi:hypothetical protein
MQVPGKQWFAQQAITKKSKNTTAQCHFVGGGPPVLLPKRVIFGAFLTVQLFLSMQRVLHESLARRAKADGHRSAMSLPAPCHIMCRCRSVRRCLFRIARLCHTKLQCGLTRKRRSISSPLTAARDSVINWPCEKSPNNCLKPSDIARKMPCGGRICSR